MKLPALLSAALLALTTLVHAGGGPAPILIDIDPGTRGDTFTSRTMPFTDLDGTTPNGDLLAPFLTFNGDQQLRFSDPASDGFDVILRLEYSANPVSTPSLVNYDVQDFRGFDLDSTTSNITVSGATVSYTLHFDPTGDIVFNQFRGFLEEIDLPGETLISASIEYLASGGSGSFEVTSPTAPGPVVIDDFAAVVSGAFPLIDTTPNDFPIQAFDIDIPGNAPSDRQTNIFLDSGTMITATADTSGDGEMEFLIDPASTAQWYFNYYFGVQDFSQGGLNNALVIDITGTAVVGVTLADFYSNDLEIIAPVIDGQAVIPLDVNAFEGSVPDEFDFTRVITLGVSSTSPTNGEGAAIGPGTYTLEKIETTSTTIITPFERWADFYSLPSGEDGPNDDPNNDGVTNLKHFAFDTNPLTSAGGNEGKQRIAISDTPDPNVYTVTIPVRSGASFNGGPALSGIASGIKYSVSADNDLIAPYDRVVYNFSPALDADLPALRDTDGNGLPDYRYQSFYMLGDISTLPEGFFIIEVEDLP